MRKYASFSGRASRSEFWLFNLVLFIISIVAATLDGILGFADDGALVLTGIISLAHIIPCIAVSVRRLHDTEKSGWWLLLSFIGIGLIVLLVFFCLESTRGPNRFGPAPDGVNNGPYSSFDTDGQPLQQNNLQAAAAPLHVAPTADPLEQLNKLKALYDDGVIDDAEFAKMKADLIGKTS